MYQSSDCKLNEMSFCFILIFGVSWTQVDILDIIRYVGRRLNAGPRLNVECVIKYMYVLILVCQDS
jgi:hypothetical protein